MSVANQYYNQNAGYYGSSNSSQYLPNQINGQQNSPEKPKSKLSRNQKRKQKKKQLQEEYER